MKKIFEAYAVYNRTVNRELTAILGKLKEEEIRKKTGTFYQTIFDTFLHIFRSDLSWIGRFTAFFSGNESLKAYSIPGDAALKEELARDYKILFKYRIDMDEAIFNFIAGLEDKTLDTVVVYKNYKGETTEKVLWKILMQMFNHQTHHRGSISAMLDIMGVENDYSTLLTKI